MWVVCSDRFWQWGRQYDVHLCCKGDGAKNTPLVSCIGSSYASATGLSIHMESFIRNTCNMWRAPFFVARRALRLTLDSLIIQRVDDATMSSLARVGRVDGPFGYRGNGKVMRRNPRAATNKHDKHSPNKYCWNGCDLFVPMCYFELSAAVSAGLARRI